MSELTPIPSNLQTDFLSEVKSDNMPDIVRDGTNVIFPAFIREETIVNDDGTTRTGFKYFAVRMAYTGQIINNYETFAYQSYATIREYFYGPVTAQLEQQLKGTFAAHQYAVRQAFPKNAGEVIDAVTRFNTIKAEFWAAVDSACALVNKTRADLPAKFNAEEMVVFAATNGMSTADISNYTAKFCVISLNLLQNNRNWDEMF